MNNSDIENVAVNPGEILTGLYERERYLQHQGQTILVHDYSGLNGDEAARMVATHADYVVARGVQDILMLVDVTDAYANRVALSAFKKNTKKNRQYFKKVAVVGAVGVVRFFLDLVNRFANTDARPFDTEQQALDWLVE